MSSKEKFKTLHNVFDEFANRTLFRLISQGHFDGLESPLSIGKEANIFTAIKGRKKVIVKIYRLEGCDFNKMYDYIKEDPRYINLKGKKRKIIFSWVQREFRNLMIARQASVKVPTPLTFRNNIIVMEFIGKKQAAPKLKDLYPDNPRKFFNDIVKNIARLYKHNLIHADLSPFNILNHDNRPVFIDFSQSTPLRSARSDELLKRDITNVSNFFTKHGLKIDEDKILKGIKQ